MVLDTLLGVYTGTNVSSLTTLASNDDADNSTVTSEVSLAVRKGSVVYIAVDTFNGVSGVIQLNHAFTSTEVYAVVTLASTNGVTSPVGTNYFPKFSAVTLAATPTNRYSTFKSFIFSTGGTFTSNPYTFLLTSDVTVQTVFENNQFNDNFETGGLANLPWIVSENEGSKTWLAGQNSRFADSSRVATNGGLFSAQTSIANLDAVNAILSLKVNNQGAAGIGRFDYLVSSEKDYDHLDFVLQDATLATWSGENGFGRLFEFTLPPGLSTLSWTYSKDAVFGDGLDLAAIDNLELPSGVTFPTAGGAPAARLSVRGAGGPNMSATAVGFPGQQVLLQQAKTLGSAWTTIQVLTIGQDGSATASGLDTSGEMMFFRLVTQSGN